MHIIDEETRRFGRLLHYAGVLATVVCATAGYSFVHAPAVHAIADTSARIEERDAVGPKRAVIREQHRIVSEKLQRSDDADRRRAAASAARRRRGRVPKEVTQLAGDEKLAIKDFQPGKPETKTATRRCK